MERFFTVEPDDGSTPKTFGNLSDAWIELFSINYRGRLVAPDGRQLFPLAVAA